MWAKEEYVLVSGAYVRYAYTWVLRKVSCGFDKVRLALMLERLNVHFVYMRTTLTRLHLDGGRLARRSEPGGVAWSVAGAVLPDLPAFAGAIWLARDGGAVYQARVL